MRTAIFMAAAVFAGAAGCKPALLPNSQIEDTEDSRAIFNTIEAYRKAMQDLDVDGVAGLVSEDYFETGGTEDPADDYGYKELIEHLREDMGQTKALRLDIHLHDIKVEDDSATVEYRYRSRAHVTFPAGDQWVTHTDVNKMRLKRAGDAWKITSGI